MQINLNTAKWIWVGSIFSSIKPKHDMRLFVSFVFFSVLTFCPKNCSLHQNKTVFQAKRVNSGKNTKVDKQLAAMFYLNWRKYGSIWYSLSCDNFFLTPIYFFLAGKVTTLEALAERESIYKLLPQCTPENTSKDFSSYTTDPKTRYPHFNGKLLSPHQVTNLYDTGKKDSMQCAMWSELFSSRIRIFTFKIWRFR